MLFLMNNFVLRLEDAEPTPAMIERRFSALSLDFVTRLGCELFAEQPVLPAIAPERARRLALMIQNKAPNINAALFVTPGLRCKPEQVAVRYADVSFETMAVLFERQQGGMLTTIEADRIVWRRLAA
jgi:altronate dehydratase